MALSVCGWCLVYGCLVFVYCLVRCMSGMVCVDDSRGSCGSGMGFFSLDSCCLGDSVWLYMGGFDWGGNYFGESG